MDPGLTSLRSAAVAIGFLAAGGLAHAQWVAVDLQPATATDSDVVDVRAGQVLGDLWIGGLSHAVVWSMADGTYLDLTPTGRAFSYAGAFSADGAVGAADVGGGSYHAGIWHGTPSSFVDLHPAASGMPKSMLNAASATQQVGMVYPPIGDIAGLWSGSGASWVNLSPNFSDSFCFAIDGATQVGSWTFPGGGLHACLWRGTPESLVDLHPAVPGLSNSQAPAAFGGVQGGFVTFGLTLTHASLWTGSAASWRDLNPAGADASEIRGMFDGRQAGSAFIDNTWRAALWSGSAESFEDLSVALPGPAGTWVRSYARTIWTDGVTIYVGGTADDAAQHSHAILWRRPAGAPPCGPADFNMDGDSATDQDIEAFFACLAGSCCPTCYTGGADFNGDGDTATDADIEAFFRVLAGGSC